MLEQIKTKVQELFQEEKIKAFVGLAEKNGQIAPHIFTSAEELDELVLGDREQPGDSRYPLSKLLLNLARAYPEDAFGILVRGCDERALNTMYVWNQLQEENVYKVGFACPQELADACECRKPYPDALVAGGKSEPGAASSTSELDSMDIGERYTYWMDQFSKCIKCYGCRDICPVCFCKECSLENNMFIQSGTLPPEIPVFHLARATHMAGRCIDCGLCEQACPVGIPLRTLYKKVENIMNEDFEYHTGIDADKKSPLNMIG